MNQDIPKKNKAWIQVWIRADTKNGFVSEFQVCVGIKKESENVLGARVVKSLTTTIIGKNHHTYCDNFFKIFYMTNSMPVELYALTGNSFQSN